MTYVDGFVIPIARKNLAAYRKMAALGAKAWKKHGALEYFECVGDDLNPKMPGMKAVGTKTERSTRVMAMIGAVISAIACFVASATESCGFSSSTRSTFSITTIASSTTMPMASTSASSDTVLAL